LAKLINSLSWNKRICLPKAIDKHETILRIDLRELNWNEAIWDSINAANPYGVLSHLASAQTCYEQTQAEPPYVRADWFVAAASRPPLYHEILGIPETDAELERLLRVEAADNIDQEKVVRAGFNRSGVSQNNRLIERHESAYGAYWKSYDFGGNTDRQNLFEYPLGPGSGAGHFRHDGGELIFTLPNGLQGYMLADEQGRRIDRGPTEIVSDPRQADKTVVNGISCMSCHYGGMITKSDEIRPFVEANRKRFDDADDILAIYPEQDVLDELFEQDAERFLTAMKQLGLEKLSKTGEPVSSMAIRFQDEVDLTMAAAELSMTPDKLQAKLKSARDLPRVMGSLLISGGTIKRDAFGEIFAAVSQELNAVSSVASRRSTGTRSSATTAGSRPANGSATNSRPTSSRLAIKGGPDSGEIRKFPGSPHPIHCVAFSPESARLAIGSLDQKVFVYDLNSSQQTRLLTGHAGQVTSVAFTADGKRLISGDYSGKVYVWDVSKKGEAPPAAQFIGHNGEVKCIEIAANSRLALSGSSDKRACLWEVSTGREVQTFGGFQRAVVAVHLASDGRSVLATDGESLCQFDAAKGTQLRVFNINAGIPQGADFSRDGRHLVCCDGYALRMWDTNTGQELPKFEAASGDMQWDVAFSSDGRKLVSGGSNHIIVWDVESRKRIELFDVEPHVYVQAVAFCPDNRHVASAIRGKTQVWRLRDK
jgi:WD40 repeat protein